MRWRLRYTFSREVKQQIVNGGDSKNGDGPSSALGYELCACGTGSSKDRDAAHVALDACACCRSEVAAGSTTHVLR